MKKFLTVLLALSVVFTYSFATVGTAFAETKTPYQIALDKVDAKAATVKADAEKEGIYDINAVNAALEEATKQGYTKVQALYEQYIQNVDPADTTAFYTSIDSWLEDGDFDDVYNEKVVNEDCKIKVSAAKDLVGTVKVSDYIDADQQTVAEYKAQTLTALDAIEAKESGITIKAIWRDDVAEWTNQSLTYRDAINIYLYGAKDSWAKIYNADDKLADVVSGTQGAGDVKGLFVMLDALTTVAEDKEKNEVTEAYIENILANITYNAKAAVDGFYPTHKVVAGDSVETFEDGVILADNTKVYGIKVTKASKITADEAVSINNALMNQINDTLDLLKTKLPVVADVAGKDGLDQQVKYYKDHETFASSMDKALAAIEFFGDVTKYGEDLKAAVNYLGEKLYSDDDIDAAIADAKEAIYGYYDGNYNKTVASYFEDVKKNPIDDPVAVALKAAIEKWQDAIVYSGPNKTAEADKKYCADYYASNPTTALSSVNWQKEYEAIRDEAKVALNEVKTVDEVDAIMADADKKLAELRTAADDNAKLNTEIQKYIDALAKYADEQWELVKNSGEYEVAYFDAAEANGKDALKAVARIDQLAGVYADAKAAFGDIKTKDALKAEAAKVQAAIIALPTTAVRLDNEDAYMAAYDLYQDYLANYGAVKADIRDHAALEKAIDNLKVLQEAAVRDAIKAMNADKVVTRAEYEAVKAMYDEYVDYYDQYGDDFDADGVLGAAIAIAGTTVRSNEIDAVVKMVSKLTTASSLKDVLAAKEAYDALTGSQQREIAKAYPYKVQLLKDRIIDSVESLKIKASSSAKKGSITVKWTVTGDASAADGFQVYKSTKAQKGYTFMGKTQKTSMVNKKNLKKGTRYYYKVRAYVDIDGVRYYSDWSNKANRIAK